MWFPWRWTKVKIADIPLENRTRYEEMGVAVVSNALSRDLVIPGPWMFIIPLEHPQRRGLSDSDYAWAWLHEQHTREDRRRDIGECVEILILFLVGVEAVPEFLSLAAKFWQLLLPAATYCVKLLRQL